MNTTKLSTRDRLELIHAEALIVADLTKGRNENHFLHDIALRYAVSFALYQIGEGITHLPKAFTDKYPDIPLAEFVAMTRTLIDPQQVHWPSVWKQLTTFLPQIDHAVAQALRRAL